MKKEDDFDDVYPPRREFDEWIDRCYNGFIMDDEPIRRQTGRRLKEARLSLRMTQAEAAAQLGMTQQQYCRFEKGEYEMNYEQLAAVCRFFDLSADYLLGLDDY